MRETLRQNRDTGEEIKMTALRQDALAMVETWPEEYLESLLEYMKQFREKRRAAHNAAYLEKLRRSQAQLERGEVVVKSLEELKELENE